MRVIIMRHGETVGNVERRYLGKSESPLTPAGAATGCLLYTSDAADEL